MSALSALRRCSANGRQWDEAVRPLLKPVERAFNSQPPRLLADCGVTRANVPSSAKNRLARHAARMIVHKVMVHAIGRIDHEEGDLSAALTALLPVVRNDLPASRSCFDRVYVNVSHQRTAQHLARDVGRHI